MRRSALVHDVSIMKKPWSRGLPAVPQHMMLGRLEDCGA